MMFENDLSPEPTLRSRVVDHLPITIVLGGALALLVSLHLAVTGVIVAAVAHVVVGVILYLVRRHRNRSHQVDASDGHERQR